MLLMKALSELLTEWGIFMDTVKNLLDNNSN